MTIIIINIEITTKIIEIIIIYKNCNQFCSNNNYNYSHFQLPIKYIWHNYTHNYYYLHYIIAVIIIIIVTCNYIVTNTNFSQYMDASSRVASIESKQLTVMLYAIGSLWCSIWCSIHCDWIYISVTPNDSFEIIILLNNYIAQILYMIKNLRNDNITNCR